MTKESIMLLKELIHEKDSRLEAIGRRLETLRKLVLEAETADEMALISQEVRNLGEEIKFLTDSRKKSKQIDKLQTGLILVLADMVESRDKNTGYHIKKTASYTEIILKRLQYKGEFKDKITKKYISDVAKAAPLHDIGKIRISDTVLNKPGKLTDEEFELMKQHTVYGGEVIEKTRPASANISYLNVAKDLATYHHEWWNGRGYPEGLKGEDIPLSARIMAVADVFDALISKRCYKDGFSFEKSMNIIREESGTHFDPLVAGAFLNAADEVRKVVEERNAGQ